MTDREVLRITAVFILRESEGGGRKHRGRVWFGEVEEDLDFGRNEFGVPVRYAGEMERESGP